MFMKVSQLSVFGASKCARPSLLSQLDARFGQPPVNPASRAKNATRSNIIKPEQGESIIPRKRPADPRLPGGTVKAEAMPFDVGIPPSTPTTLKKLKTDGPKSPLAPANRNTASSSQVQTSTPGLSMTEATAQMNDIQQKLTRTELDFRRLARKKRKTKAEMTKFGKLSKDIDRLQASQNDYAAIITSLAPAPPSIASAIVPSRVVPHLPAQFPPPFYKPAFHTFGEQKPIGYQPQPVASGSNVRLPDAWLGYGDVKMSMSNEDDEDDDRMSSDEPGLPMGPPGVALGGYGENFDSDGNFHGRGRDRFVGPRANPDE